MGCEKKNAPRDTLPRGAFCIVKWPSYNLPVSRRARKPLAETM